MERTAEEMVAYLTDCTLATVAKMAMTRRRPKHEYQRQISIAQKGVDQLVQDRIRWGSRVDDIVSDYGGSVAEWAKKFEPET